MTPTPFTFALPGRRLLVGSGCGMRARALVAVRLEPASLPGSLAAPGAAFVTDDGRALAWFGDGRPCIVHPSLRELCRLHGVEVEATLAA
ncbi:MAG TPA: hypothetical protein VFZ53_12155 [Polyangiaceae bacterium]